MGLIVGASLALAAGAPGVPTFGPEFCSAYDFVAAGYLAVLLRLPRFQHQTTANPVDVPAQL